MISTLGFANTSITSHAVMGTCEMCPLGTFLYIIQYFSLASPCSRLLEFTYFVTRSLYRLTNFSPFPAFPSLW